MNTFHTVHYKIDPNLCSLSKGETTYTIIHAYEIDRSFIEKEPSCPEHLLLYVEDEEENSQDRIRYFIFIEWYPLFQQIGKTSHPISCKYFEYRIDLNKKQRAALNTISDLWHTSFQLLLMIANRFSGLNKENFPDINDGHYIDTDSTEPLWRERLQYCEN